MTDKINLTPTTTKTPPRKGTLALLGCSFAGLITIFYSDSTSPNPFDLKDLVSDMEAKLEPNPQGLGNSTLETGTKPKRSGGVQSLLGEHSKLVNLDDLVSSGGTTGSGMFLMHHQPQGKGAQANCERA